MPLTVDVNSEGGIVPVKEFLMRATLVKAEIAGIWPLTFVSEISRVYKELPKLGMDPVKPGNDDKVRYFKVGNVA
jgi:hypothetical protein